MPGHRIAQIVLAMALAIYLSCHEYSLRKTAAFINGYFAFKKGISYITIWRFIKKTCGVESAKEAKIAFLNSEGNSKEDMKTPLRKVRILVKAFALKVGSGSQSIQFLRKLGVCLQLIHYSSGMYDRQTKRNLDQRKE
jgi:hypothetical protein